MPQNPLETSNVKPDAVKLFFLLLAGDLIFLLLHLVHKFTPFLPETLFSLTRDGGYAEFYQYTKELWIILLLFALTLRKRKLLYASYAGLFLYFLADDFFQIHEIAGQSLANFLQLHPTLGLRPQDTGELTVFAFFSLIFAVLIGLAHYLSDKPTRFISRKLLILVGLLAFFGIVFDMLEISVNHAVLGPILAILDDGGEILVMSAIVWFVFRLPLSKISDPNPQPDPD